jgi:hypothetical protein
MTLFNIGDTNKKNYQLGGVTNELRYFETESTRSVLS